jgi:hypothetical protein
MRQVTVLLVALVMLMASCSSGATDTTTTAIEAASATTPSTPTTSEPTTTTVVDLFAAPAVYEKIARDYCSSWPDVAGLLSEDANFIDVPIDGLAVPDKVGFSKGLSEDVVQGRDAVLAAVADTRFSTADCGGPATVSGDWVALSVSASTPDGSGEEGIWLFRIVKDKIQWHFIYGTGAGEVTPAPAEPDAVLAAEARDFCAIIEGTGYTRDADEFLAAMTDDPAVHNNPEGLYWTGVDEVRSMVNYYPSNDDIW